MGAVDGVLPVAKPAGVTSHDVVATLRRALPRGTKVGHAGTLDPFATGLLLVLVGRATRAQRLLMSLPKTYRAVARLGWTSSTGDRDGELIHSGRIPASLEIPSGEQMQRPPAHSAIRVGGRRAYQLARAGEEVELAPRPITVHRAELLEHAGERAIYEIECSAGTYVRTLISDLGDAYCEELERTRIGDFLLEQARPPGEAADVPPLALDRALAFLPERALTDDEAGAVKHGRRVPLGDAPPDAPDVRLTHGGVLLAVGAPRPEPGPEASELHPALVLRPA
jgi:tRNA pseudouridine55 synthase